MSVPTGRKSTTSCAVAVTSQAPSLVPAGFSISTRPDSRAVSAVAPAANGLVSEISSTSTVMTLPAGSMRPTNWSAIAVSRSSLRPCQ